jgi:hypothetical protein
MLSASNIADIGRGAYATTPRPLSPCAATAPDETRALRLPGPSTLRETIDLLASNSEAFVIAGDNA